MKVDWFKEYFGLHYVIGDNTKAFGFNSLDERIKYDVNEIIKYSEIKDKSKILDIPCGYGKHAIELAKRNNNEIYGVDINNDLINIAIYRKNNCLDINEKSIKLKGKAKFMVGDMRNFSDILNNFNLVYNWFWSFGYFSHKENLKTLKEFYNCLNKNGILLIHIIPEENILGYLEDYKRETFPIKIMNKNYPKSILNLTKIFDKKNKTLHTTWRIMLENKIVLPQQPVISSIIIYSKDEYFKMLKDMGFKNIEIYDSYFPLKIFRSEK